MKPDIAASCCLAFLTACSGGTSAIGGSTQSVFSPQVVPASAIRTSAVPYSVAYLYVSNTGNDSITIYRHDASGNEAPLGIIKGSNTRLHGAGNLSQDASGNLYVANGAMLLVFAHGANGNVAPIRVLTGPLTQIHEITAMTVDTNTGKIFVADADPSLPPFEDPILRFAPNATGNVSPFARGGYAGDITSMASDSTGENLITSARLGVDNFDAQIVTFPKQFPNENGVPFVRQITSIYSSAIVDDPTTKSFLFIGSTGIVRLSESTTGYGDNTGHTGGLKPPPISTINSSCASQLAIAPGPSPNTYVTHSGGGACTDAVYVYPNAASGKAKPLRILSGPATLLSSPSGIFEGK